MSKIESKYKTERTIEEKHIKHLDGLNLDELYKLRKDMLVSRDILNRDDTDHSIKMSLIESRIKKLNGL